MTEKHLRDFVKIKIKLDKEAVEWQADTRRQQEASKAKLAEPRRLRMFERDMTRIHAEIFERLQTLIQQSKPVLPDPYDQADRAIAWSGDLREIHAVVIRRFIVQSAAFCRFAVIGAGIAGFLIGLFLRSG